MPKRMTTDDQLATLRRLRAGESSPAAIAELGTLLHTAKLHGLTLKGAADLAEKWDARPLAAALAQAAESLAPGMVEDPNKRDPGAEGKQAALRALVAWEAELPDLFLKAAAWKQHAPVMNGSVDVAAECRGLAAIGIAQTRAGGPEEAVSRMVDLLADQEHPTRARAAQALGMWRGPEAVPVLRLKALTGDEQPEVLGEVFASLIRHDPRSHLPFVTRFLDHEEEPIVEAAALALGESRQAAALPALAAAWQRLARRPVSSSILMAITLLRHEDSLAWLLELIREGRDHDATSALDALRLYRGDAKVAKLIEESARKRGGEILRVFEEVFR